MRPQRKTVMRPRRLRLAIPKLDWLPAPNQLSACISNIYAKQMIVVKRSIDIPDGPRHRSLVENKECGWIFYETDVLHLDEGLTADPLLSVEIDLQIYILNRAIPGHLWLNLGVKKLRKIKKDRCYKYFKHQHDSNWLHSEEIHGQVQLAEEILDAIHDGQEPDIQPDQYSCGCYGCLELDRAAG